MSIKIWALLFGMLLIVIGILGFIPSIASNGQMLNLFTVNWIQNLVHIVTGVIALFVATSSYSARIFFKIFGILYLFLGLLGVLVHGEFVALQLNTADNIFHFIIGILAIYLGFGKPRREKSAHS